MICWLRSLERSCKHFCHHPHNF